MFEVNGVQKDVECGLCSKIKECYLVVCRKGTMDGPLCPSCLTAQCRMRASVKKPAHDNGQPVSQH